MSNHTICEAEVMAITGSPEALNPHLPDGWVLSHLSLPGRPVWTMKDGDATWRVHKDGDWFRSRPADRSDFPPVIAPRGKAFGPLKAFSDVAAAKAIVNRSDAALAALGFKP